MPLSLAAVVSQCFYEGHLVSGYSAPRDGFDFENPLRFIKVNGTAQQARNSTSLVNEEEAKAAAAAANALAGAHRNQSVVVLCTYKAQTIRIREMLVNQNAEALTVDAAQGREWDHVILSVVGSNPQRLGFLRDVRRQCVALSRAMRTMTLVAHPDVVQKLPAMACFCKAVCGHNDSVPYDLSHNLPGSNEARGSGEKKRRKDAPHSTTKRPKQASGFVRRVSMPGDIAHAQKGTSGYMTIFTTGDAAPAPLSMTAKMKKMGNDEDHVKIVMCRSWNETGKCEYESQRHKHCNFAHGQKELIANLARHKEKKTEKQRTQMADSAPVSTSNSQKVQLQRHQHHHQRVMEKKANSWHPTYPTPTPTPTPALSCPTPIIIS